MKTIEMDEVQHDFPALCQAVASTGQAVVVTRGQEPLVSIVPMPHANGGREGSVWGLRRQFEERHGALSADFDLPPRDVDEPRWQDPLKELGMAVTHSGENGQASSRSRPADRRHSQDARSDCGPLNVRHFSRIPDLPFEDWSVELS